MAKSEPAGAHLPPKKSKSHRALSLLAGLILGFAGFGIYKMTGTATQPKTPPAQVLNSNKSPNPASPDLPIKPAARATPPPGRVPSTAQKFATIEAYLASVDPNGEWTVHRNADNLPVAIMGGKIPLPQGRASLLEQMQILTPFLIGHSAELRSTGHETNTSLSRVQSIEQRAEGYTVYGAIVRVSMALDDSEIYEVSSDLRPVTEVDTKRSVGFNEARERLEKRESPRGILRLNGEEEPLIYGTTSAVNELAWRFHVQVQRPRKDTREILVSAKDGRILMDRSVLRR